MSSGEEVVLKSNTVLDPEIHYEYEDIMIYDDPKSMPQIWNGESQNVLIKPLFDFVRVDFLPKVLFFITNCE